MGYEVTRRRVYGPQDRYCNGSGLSTLHGTLEEAQRAYDHRSAQDAGYPSATFLIDLGADVVLRQTGPSLAEVDAAMVAAHRRRYEATYRLIWGPTAQCIGTVQARTPSAAIRKAPAPYRRFLGEIRAEVQS